MTRKITRQRKNEINNRLDKTVTISTNTIKTNTDKNKNNDTIKKVSSSDNVYKNKRRSTNRRYYDKGNNNATDTRLDKNKSMEKQSVNDNKRSDEKVSIVKTARKKRTISSVKTSDDISKIKTKKVNKKPNTKNRYSSQGLNLKNKALHSATKDTELEELQNGFDAVNSKIKTGRKAVRYLRGSKYERVERRYNKLVLKQEKLIKKQTIGNKNIQDARDVAISQKLDIIKTSNPIVIKNVNSSFSNIRNINLENNIKKYKNLKVRQFNGSTIKSSKKSIKKTAVFGTKTLAKKGFNSAKDSAFDGSDDEGVESLNTINKSINTGFETKKSVKNTSKAVENIRTRKVRKQEINHKKDQTKLTKQKIKTLKKAKEIQRFESAQVAKYNAKVIAQGATKVIGNIFAAVGSAILPILLVCIIIFTVVNITTSTITLSYPMAEEERIIEINNLVKELDDKANEQLEDLKNSDCDHLDFTFDGDRSSIATDFQSFLTLITIYSDFDLESLTDDNIRELHEQTYNIEHYQTSEETYYDDGTSETEVTLHINLSTYSFIDMQDILEFTDDQKEMANFMVQNDLNDMYPNLVYTKTGGLSESEINEILANSGTTNTTRRELLEVALSLNDYTVYEWGGKASGSVEKPKGLDCSGYVAWVYDRAGVTSDLQKGGTTVQWDLTIPIKEESLEPGDLGFKQPPSQDSSTSINHVGIYLGNGQWIECYGSHGVGITSGKSFHYYRKVKINFEE